MSESSMRGRLVKMLRPMHAVAVENGRTHPGTPDINYIEGWIECKWMRRWPRNAETKPVLLPHELTKEQRIFLADRWSRGGSSWAMLQIGREYLLFAGDIAAEYLGRVPRPELYRVAAEHWPRGMDKWRLRECLIRSDH